MHLYEEKHTHIQRSTMHLYKEVHAQMRRVGMFVLRNTRTRQLQSAVNRLSIILACFHRFLSIFRLLVGILPALFSWRSRLRLQKQDRQFTQQYTKSVQTPHEPIRVQGNRRLYIKHTYRCQAAHVLLSPCGKGFPRHSMPCALRFRCGMMREQRGATPPRVFERYLFWWLWTTEVTPKEKPPTRKTNEGMLTS